ncbi:MAG: DUF5036 family protein [Dysgonamonadaceae bacterium]|jgi:hypothetical protein|nr:DUF5036 family protein [Dysgonamonadaceae bacterium]
MLQENSKQPHAIRAMETETIQKNGASPKSLMSRRNLLYFFLIGCLVATSMCIIAGCDKDDPDDPNNAMPDPKGTILISVRNCNNGCTYIYPDGVNGSYFYIGSDDNFFSYHSSIWKFATIGKMRGLGNVTKIPTSGWATKVAVVPGYGYVGRHSDYNDTTYVRIYVVDYLEGTSGGVIGANVKYQSPFEP